MYIYVSETDQAEQYNELNTLNGRKSTYSRITEGYIRKKITLCLAQTNLNQVQNLNQGWS